ncbi:MAG: PSD1 and planctomycete cytochrome C domain-containing protein [Acidobacteriia bacterium]|nr:PSD1 and planctomycete cytochrome C domain-containing protein [Terriglobia bacterium]
MGGKPWKPLGLAATAAVLMCLCLAPKRLASQSAPALIDYDREIHAILAVRCLVCHSQEKRSGGLSLATYEDVLGGGRSGAIVKPGNSGGSLMFQRITAPPATRMPLGGPPLTDSEIRTIASWIDQGARPAPNAPAAKARWEAPLTLERPKPPVSPWKSWSGPLDRYTAAYLASHGASEPPLVSDAVFARRAWLDIWGLLPPPAELRAFLEERTAGKRQRLVAALLADDRKYAENWISYWNDLLRNEEGVTYYSETAGRKSITDWLLAALESNTPYNQWISTLLNPTAPGDPDGFLIGVNWRGTVSASQTPALQAAQNTAQIFLGINLKCNSCHDSFISKWKLKDAYSLAAYFSAEEKLQLYRCDVSQQQYATAGFLFPELDRRLPSESATDRRAAAAAIFTDPHNGRVPRTLVNRIWQKLMGRGIVENVDEMDGEPWSPELLDWLASDFVDSGYDLKALISTIVNSRTYQLAAVPGRGEASGKYEFRGPELRRMTAEQFADCVASITGEWPVGRAMNPQAPGRGGPAVISGAPSDGASLKREVPSEPRPSGSVLGTAPAAISPRPAPLPIPPGNYVREWRIAGSSLDRALGRPIRDQVYSTRDTQATTIQALELVNGNTLTHWLWRGARRMLGEPPPEPVSLVSRQSNAGRSTPAPFEVDISKSEKLYLIVQDALSTAPDKAAPLWIQAELSGPNGITPLSALMPLDPSGLREDNSPLTIAGGTEYSSALRVKLSSVLVYDIAGKGFTRLQGATGFEAVPLIQGESVQARFFAFDRQPDMDRLVPPNPETPLPAGPVLHTVSETIDRVYWYALGRAPSIAERRVAEAALRDQADPRKPSADGLADLLWAVMMTPEFQMIR